MAEGSEQLIKTLTEYGKLGVMALRQDVQKVSATGKTADSIRFEISKHANGDITLSILARQYFKTLETGRGPRKSSEYGQFDISLEEYLQAKGVPQRTSKSGVKYFKLGDSWMSAKSLAYKINKEGDRVYKQGGREVYSDTLAKLVSELKRAITQEYPKFYLREILKN